VKEGGNLELVQETAVTTGPGVDEVLLRLRQWEHRERFEPAGVMLLAKVPKVAAQ
jgi:hypothetical protein